MYFHLEPNKAVIGDINTALIDFYKEIGSDKFKMIKRELLDIQKEYESNRNLFMTKKLLSPESKVEDHNIQNVK